MQQEKPVDESTKEAIIVKKICDVSFMCAERKELL